MEATTCWKDAYEVQVEMESKLRAFTQRQGLLRLRGMLRRFLWERLSGRGGQLHSWQSRAKGVHAPA